LSSENIKPEVLAIIVTFNRPEKLRAAVEAVLAQEKFCHILVVDNASRDETKLVLDNLEGAYPHRISTMRLAINTGGAGGFFYGLKEGYERGYEAFWLMDDDCIALPSALRILDESYRGISENSGVAPGFVCSNVRWTDGSYAEMNSPSPAVDWLSTAFSGCCSVSVRSCSFVSVLLPRTMVARVGLPLKEYFIWFDDTEYTTRITNIARGVLCLDSVVIHDMDKKEGSDSPITNDNLWKFKYRFRNESSYYWHRHGKSRYMKFTRRSLRKIFKSDIGLSKKIALCGCLLKGVKFDPRQESV